MVNVKICKRCVMDSTVPKIIFNKNGICNYCEEALLRIKNETFEGTQRDKNLTKLLNKIKSFKKNNKYDCVIGVSGGVDSSYVAYIIKKEFKLNPLAVHLDNGWNSELAIKNIENLLTKLQIDLYTHVIDWEEFRELQMSFLKSSIANSEIPTDHAITALLYKIAEKEKIKYILHGGNLATESIMPESWMHDAKDLKFLNSIHKKFSSKSLKSYPMMSYLKLFWKIFIKRIKYVGILNYISYDKDKAIEILEKNLGWKKYEEKHFESIYTKFFQGYLLPKKFGIDKRKAHYSSLIINGQMTRTEALEKLKMPTYNSKTLDNDIEYVCQKFEISLEEFNKIINIPIKYSSDYKNNNTYNELFKPFIKIIKKIATAR